jgi:hypothetical protein
MFTFDPSDAFFNLHPSLQPWTSTPPTEAGIYKLRVGGRCGTIDDVSVYEENGVWFAEEGSGQRWPMENLAKVEVEWQLVEPWSPKGNR